MKVKIFLLIIVIVSLMNCASKPIWYTERTLIEKRIARIAVLPFNSPSGAITSGDLASDMFTIVLMKKGYVIADRQMLKKIMQEKELTLSGITSEQITQLGRILNVDAIITGSVTAWESEIQKVEYGIWSMIFAFSGSRISATVGITARVLDINSGQIIWVGSDEQTESSFKEATYKSSLNLVNTMEKKITLPN